MRAGGRKVSRDWAWPEAGTRGVVKREGGAWGGASRAIRRGLDLARLSREMISNLDSRSIPPCGGQGVGWDGWGVFSRTPGPGSPTVSWTVSGSWKRSRGQMDQMW